LLGSRKCNIIHTRLRHQCSSLGADLFRANIISDPSCACGCPLEDAIHYLLECHLYTNARMQLIMIGIWNEPLLSGHLSEKANLSLSLYMNNIYIFLSNCAFLNEI
jgi:hypothetical protein